MPELPWDFHLLLQMLNLATASQPFPELESSLTSSKKTDYAAKWSYMLGAALRFILISVILNWQKCSISEVQKNLKYFE